ncbi:TetR/AcrR family transcriptional regulator [Acinetobacter baumannii]|uniref:TetR/AcrR family transcriptional regulator n=1 Tax=Acinetobacter baumannii TaxID=470 RepID=UPI0034E2D15C
MNIHADNPSQKREDILRTALSLFNQYGFNVVGIDRIISESKVAKMTFYRHFPSKMTLIEACLTRQFENLQRVVAVALLPVDPDQPLEQIKAIFFSYVEFSQSEDFNGCLFNRAMVEVYKQHPTVSQYVHQYRKWITEQIKQRLIAYNVKSPDTITNIILYVIEGILAARGVTYTSNNDFENMWNCIERTILFKNFN